MDNTFAYKSGYNKGVQDALYQVAGYLDADTIDSIEESLLIKFDEE